MAAFKCYFIALVLLICILLLPVFLLDNQLSKSISLPFLTHWKTTKDEMTVPHANYYRNVLPSKSRWKREVFPCFKGAFQDVLVVVTYNSPFYDNIDIINKLYKDVFGKVVHCGADDGKNDGQKQDILVDVAGGHRGYICMALAIKKYPGFQGYLYVNDDMIVNWWRLLDFDRKKVWQGPEFVEFNQDAYGEIINKGWMWWTMPIGLAACGKVYEQMKELAEKGTDFDVKTALKIYLDNGEGRPRCGKGWSDFLYVPGHLAKTAQRIFEIQYEQKLFLEMAVMNVLHSLDYKRNFEILKGVYLPDLWLNNPADGREFWGVYNSTITFIHPFKYGFKEYAAMNKALVEHWILDITKSLTRC